MSIPFRYALPIAAISAITAATFAADLDYPQTRKVDRIDVYHGTQVSDPYQWLETDVRESTEVKEWVDAENAVTFSYLESIGERNEIKDRLTDLWNYERFSSPFKVAGTYYYYRNDGLQNQSVLYAVDTLDGEPRVVIDPNAWKADGTAALSGLSFSEDGRYLAYAKAVSGSDWTEWFIKDLHTGNDTTDHIEWTKFGGLTWTHDNRGFFYSRFPAVPKEELFTSTNLNNKVYYHRLGTDQSEDVLVFERPDHPEWGFGSSVTEDGRYLVISVYKGTDSRNMLFIKDLDEPYGLPITLIDNFDHEWGVIGNDGTTFYFQTTLHAPNRRVVSMDITKGPASVRQVIAEAPEALQGVGLTGNMFVASYLKDAVSYVRMFRTDGTHVRDVEFPGLGSGGGFGGKRSDTETFYSFSSYNTPPSIYRYDMITGESTLFRRAAVDFKADDYTVEQVFYESKDGTRVPMFLAHKKGLKKSPNTPTMLYGYGGFDIPITPGFSPAIAAWMEMGGVWAVANIRGGGEYGESWHKAGIKTKKQNVFDDFIGAAEWLIDNGYTSTPKLAIHGRSNGGLLVGAVMTQRPDLFGAAFPGVGVMDMLKFHTWTAGRYWVDDYGNAELDKAEFDALNAYSPYHQLVRQAGKGVQYPATMVTTADTDDRVVPGHSFKFAAALQESQAGDAPVLIRIETSAGHGGGKPTAKQIEEWADMFAFAVKNLKINLTGDWPGKQ